MGKWVSKRFSSLGSKAGENDSGGEYVSRSAQSKGDHVSKPKVERKSASEDKSSAPKPAANLGKVMEQTEFFTEYGEMNRYVIHEVVGKGSYGVVCSATDKKTGEKVAIKKITDVFEHVSDATRILREIKLLRKLKHPDIVEIKHIMLPPSEREFRDIFVVFELMESDLHQVIKANDDLTTEHYKYFMYQLLSGLMHVHSANVFHRDLKPKNILANADCKLKICDFGLARPAFNDQPSTVFWTDYVATRWYRAPELCGSFFSKYTPAVDVWGLGCILAEVILGKPLFPGRNVVHQLELITDLLGTPTPEHLAKVRNDKARRFLANMKLKPAVPFSSIFDGIDLGIVNLLEKMLKFDPADRPSATQCLQDVLFNGLRTPAHEARAQPISKLSFEFERRKLSKDDVRHLIYQEILEYHPQFKSKMVDGDRGTGHFVYPSAVDRFKREFAAAEAQIPGGDAAMQKDSGMDMRSSCSMPRERVLLNEGVQQAQATDMARSSSIGQRALEDEIMEENEQGSLQMN
eukprot:CAMPEP_0196583864 /NCGR_PEP_ID=MMETSP1081-20130531/45002_1 /TAXON_ID=36882 /ORGANISM="Pyramimonas amylifera, Strain CCMP720" /LENGTH=519 /DNA_ID=CAMNT_0041904891 /DNA_START=455 /DNA_END=2014 /DNA_ORIENTATION=-